MIQKLINRFLRLIEAYQFKLVQKLLIKYSPDLYHIDKLNTITKINYLDFEYIMKTKNSCDAIPFMIEIDKKVTNWNISVDIGANVGITTVWMAKNSKKVYAFEPERENIKKLKENLIINNTQNVEVVQKAVSDCNGIMTLNILEGYGHHSLGKVATSKIVGTQEINVISLDTFCLSKGIDHIDFLKVDVEGFEIEVFKGAENLFINKKIGLIAFEISKVPLYSLNKTEKELFEFLDKYGYDIFYANGTIFDITTLHCFDHIDLIAQPRL